MRYFTSEKFHSKLYVFGDRVALVGSANLTEAGLQSNQEICVSVESEDYRFDRLVQLFQSYWEQATPLDAETLKNYEILLSMHKGEAEHLIEKTIKATFGDIAPAGVQVGIPKKTHEQTYLLSYRQTYQEFLVAFLQLEAIYRLFDQRQQPEEAVPLRIEIDLFLSFVRETFTQADNYREAPLRHGDDRESFVRQHVQKWFEQRWSHLDENIPGNYAKIRKALGSPGMIKSATYEEIVDALCVCHAFHDQLRFHKGAMPALRRDFMRDNQVNRVKATLTYLLFDQSNFIQRMGNCIFNGNYALHWFGRSCVQEAYGWMNNENIPICNGRTVKALRYLGFDVQVF